jgi:antibiotic biosynthesis monooxygenase (ABM) superfamily enzyme
MEKDLIMPQGKSVTVVISRRVYPGHERDYDAWVRKLVAAATEAPGNTGATMLFPEPGKPGLHHVVLHFADQEAVHRWEDSYIRQKLSHEADVFSVRSRQEATGLETWFYLPEHPELTHPPRWKMFLVTSLAVYIVSSIIVPIQGRLEDWPFLVGNILSSLLVVGSLTWVLMPLFSRYVFRKWLYRE